MIDLAMARQFLEKPEDLVIWISYGGLLVIGCRVTLFLEMGGGRWSGCGSMVLLAYLSGYCPHGLCEGGKQGDHRECLAEADIAGVSFVLRLRGEGVHGVPVLYSTCTVVAVECSFIYFIFHLSWERISLWQRCWDPTTNPSSYCGRKGLLT